jgi:branched-chain amino acid transport system permease protein
VNWQLLFDNFMTYTVGGLTAGSIYALVALGYTLVYGVLRLINFAHSEVFMLGTFAALWAADRLGIAVGPDSIQAGLALAATILVVAIVSMVISGGAALAIERIGYRPLRKRGAGRLAALISAIGMSFAIAEAVGILVSRNPQAFPRILERRTLFTIFGANVRTDQVLVIVSAILLMILLDQFIKQTRLGRGVRAVAQDAETATLMGVDIDRVIMLTFLLGGIAAGWAAMLNMVFFETTTFDIGFVLGVKAFTAAVLGGIGNLRGALLGGLLLGVMENYGSAVFGGQWKDVIAFTVLVVVLMVRPNGILGETLGRARA